jgi:protein-disulfide isomerase
MNLRRFARTCGLSLLFAVAALSAAAAANPPVFADDRTMGDPKAPVVVVEYAAPMCPHCARFARDVFPLLKQTYIDTGKVLYVLRIFPLGAPDAAVAGMAKCVGPTRYFEFLDLAFKKQAMWDPDGYDIPDVKAALVQLGGLGGLKPDDATRCMEDKDEFERINRIAEDGQTTFHIEAVPSLVVDGKVLLGAEAGWPALQARIDGLLAQVVVAPAPKPAPHKTVVHKHHHHKHGHHRHHGKRHLKHHKAYPAHAIVKANKAKTN